MKMRAYTVSVFRGQGKTPFWRVGVLALDSQEALRAALCDRTLMSMSISDISRIEITEHQMTKPAPDGGRFILTALKSGGCTAKRADVPDAISVRVTDLEMVHNPGAKLSDLLEVRISIAEERRRAAKPAPDEE